jgi:quinol-cytochrome oxidoreductase complex cytochrome b subunit
MNVTLCVLLLVNAAFNFFVWPTFFRRVVRDPRARDAAGKATPFFTVHLVIFVVAMAIAAASAIAAVSALLGLW